ncbi:hypothetical protein OVX87_29385 [Klebsiella pneumoniae]|nr:hypothetical protein [Klebsiella pneumoniae]
MDWLEDMGHYRLTVEDHPQGEEARRKTNHYVTGRDGGRDIDLRAFALQECVCTGVCWRMPMANCTPLTTCGPTLMALMPPRKN